jgi:hypothetical protein
MRKTRVIAAALAVLAALGCERPAFAPVENSEGSWVPAPAATERPVDLAVGAAFTSAELRGFAGGMVDARGLGADCIGQIPLVAQHLLEVRDPIGLTFSATPQGAGFMDLALAIRGVDGGVWCADDGNSLDPVLAEVFEPGRYEVLVAAISTETPPYSLTIRSGLHPVRTVMLGQSLPAPAQDGPAPEPTTEGQFGGLRVAAGTGPATLSGLAGGSARARELGADCDGFVAPAPDHVIELQAPETLTLRVQSADDTTLVVLGPNGTVWCRDDVEGLNPALRESLGPGRYSVYVGVWEQGQASAYELTVSR